MTARRPTVERIREEAEHTWDSAGDVTRERMIRDIYAESSRTQTAIKVIDETMSRRDRRSLVTMVVTICGFIAAMGAAITALSQLGIFSAQHGWAFESKDEAKTEHKNIRDEMSKGFAPVNEKLDKLYDALVTKRRK